MRVLLELAAFLILAVAIWGWYCLLLRPRRGPKVWEVQEISTTDGGIIVRLVKRGQLPVNLGVAHHGDNFDYELAELRAQAKSEARTLNLARKILR